MDEEDFKSFATEDFIAAIKQLQSEIDEKDNTIREQENELYDLRRGVGGKNANIRNNADQNKQIQQSQQELAAMRDKLIKEQSITTNLKEQVANLTAKLNVDSSEKSELEADLRRARKTVEDLEKELTEAQEASRLNGRKSVEIIKQKKDTQKQQLQLYDENEALQNEVL